MITYFIWLMSALAVLAIVRWVVFTGKKLPKFRVRVMRLRVRLRLHPVRGHATVFELWLRWGRFAAFRRSRRARWSLPFWYRAVFPAAHSLVIGRAHYRHGLRVPVDEHVTIMAPPRAGKTGFLAGLILAYPGPVVSTTTKHDVYQLTAAVRSRMGPVLVFNPQGIGGVASTFRWNPIAGCEDPSVAIRRADAFANAVSMAGTEDASFWSAKASSYLRALFHAAALAEGDMTDAARWTVTSAEEAEEILMENGALEWAAELGELRGKAQKTAQTIRMVMSRALAFMADPVLAAAVRPGPGEGFDIPAFLASSGTLYLIAESDYDDSPVAPLFAAMAGEIHHAAALIGQATPGGRLDPPLLMALDEIVQTCPVPLPHWLADSGGKGIQLIAVTHGEAQLRTRWGDDGAQVILDTSGVKIWLSGVTDLNTLRTASGLCGTVAFREKDQYHDTRHEVMTPEMIRQLPPGYALIIRGSLAPVIAKLPMAWKNPAYKAARRAGNAIAARAGEPPAITSPDPLALPPGSRRPSGPRPSWPRQPAERTGTDPIPGGPDPRRPALGWRAPDRSGIDPPGPGRRGPRTWPDPDTAARPLSVPRPETAARPDADTETADRPVPVPRPNYPWS